MPEITSPMIWASTQTRMSGACPWSAESSNSQPAEFGASGRNIERRLRRRGTVAADTGRGAEAVSSLGSNVTDSRNEFAFLCAPVFSSASFSFTSTCALARPASRSP